MIFVKVENSIVELIHYKPFHEKHGLGKTREELEGEGMFVYSIPDPEQIDGKSATLYGNPETKELWYEYEDIPKTEEELQKERIQDLENALLEMSTLQAIKDAENEQAIMELTMMLGGI